MSMKFHHLVLDKNKTRAALNQLMEFQPLFSELEKKHCYIYFKEICNSAFSNSKFEFLNIYLKYNRVKQMYLF